jgi:serine/threonine-protein kinase
MSDINRAPWAHKYTRVKRLGDGGQGTTFLVRSAATNEQFALKELQQKHQRDPSRRSRLRIEATTLEVLQHPGIPRVIEHNGDAFRDLDTPMFMVMDYAEGGTLRQRVNRIGPFGVNAAVAVAIQLFETLAYCHGQDVVHRDVKPDNIAFRTHDGDTPVLLDFGLTFNWRRVDANLTRSGEQLGNRFLHLPELLSGADRRDARSDVTQCAGVLLYMLTGIDPVSLLDERGFAPHRRPDVHALLAAVVPSSMFEFFEQAFQSRMSDRFQSAESARMALSDIATMGERTHRGVTVAKRIRDRLLDDDAYVGEAAAREVLDNIAEILNRAVKAVHAELAIPGTATKKAEVRGTEEHLAWIATVGLSLDAGIRFVHLSQFRLRVIAREVLLTSGAADEALLRAPIAGFSCTPQAVAAVAEVVLGDFESAFNQALSARHVMQPITPDLKRTVVDIVADEHLRTCANVSGADIVLRLRPAARELCDRAVDACVPRWLSHGNPRPMDDYRPTLAGLLASKHGDQVRDFIERVLTHWKCVAPRAGTAARIRADQPEFAQFENSFKSAVMALSRLGGNGDAGSRDQPFDYGVPFRFLDVLQCDSAEEVVTLWHGEG